MEYTVRLDNFNGPLDLLLYLIKQEEVEIHEVSIASICTRYLEYIRAMESLDVDVSSEFLVMAATLMLIKSRSLLPREEAIDIEEELDPEDELIQQLLEYKQYKVASRDLSEMAELRARIVPYAPPRAEREDPDIELEEVDVWDLVKAFAAMLQQTGLHKLPRVLKDEKPLRAYISEVFEAVRRSGKLTFKALFEDAASRETVVGRFIALLELVRSKRVTIHQEVSYDTIEIAIADGRDLSDEEIEVMEADLESLDLEQAGLLDEADQAASSGDGRDAGSGGPWRFDAEADAGDAERELEVDDEDEGADDASMSVAGG